jgi:PIN domain nuclease of toxin-antitoxin system
LSDTDRWIVDASAIIAVLLDEPGRERVEALLPSAAISSVNLSEVVTAMLNRGHDFTEAVSKVSRFALEVIDFTEDHAFEAARLRPLTAKQGLSLGDRACLALASIEGLPVMTADRSWGSVDVGVQIDVIR